MKEVWLCETFLTKKMALISSPPIHLKKHALDRYFDVRRTPRHAQLNIIKAEKYF